MFAPLLAGPAQAGKAVLCEKPVGGTPDTQAPTAPSNLTATGGVGSVSLSWGASTDNVGVTNYNVYRSTTSGRVR